MFLMLVQTTTTTTPPSAVAEADGSLTQLLWFGAATLGAFAIVYWFSFNKSLGRRTINVTFSRLYGLITVAVLGVALAFAAVGDESRTAAFTLLGTIAGYLAGAKPSEAPTTTVRPIGDDGAPSGGGSDGAPPTDGSDTASATFETESLL